MADLLDFKATQDKVEELELFDYTFHFDAYLHKAYKMYVKHYKIFTGYTLLYFLIYNASSFVVGPLIALAQPAFSVGYYMVCYRMDRQKPFELSNFFDSFKYILQIMLGVLVSMLAVVVLTIPFVMLGMPFFQNFVAGNEATNFIGIIVIMILYMITLTFLWVSFSLTYSLIAFWDMNFWVAFQASYRIVIKKWWHFLGFYLILASLYFTGFQLMGLVLALVGYMGVVGTIWMVVIGTFIFMIVFVLVTPFCQCAVYALFEDIVGFKSEYILPPTPNKGNFATKQVITPSATTLPPTPDKLKADNLVRNKTNENTLDDWKIIY
jgi:hypothetical protein